MATEGQLYRWVYFTDTTGVRRILRRWLDDDANVTGSDEFTFPAPPTGFARYPASLLGDQLICADWNPTTQVLQVRRIELIDGAEHLLWSRGVGAFVPSMQPYGGPPMYAAQPDASTLLLAVRNIGFVIDTSQWVVVNDFYVPYKTSPSGQGPAFAVSALGVYAVAHVTTVDLTGNNDVDRYRVYGPFDPRALEQQTSVSSVVDSVGDFGVERDPYGHNDLDGMLSAIDALTDDTIERASYCGYLGGVASRIVSGTSRTYNHGQTWSGQPMMQPAAFVDVTPVERPTLTAILAGMTFGDGIAPQFVVGVDNEYWSSDLDWTAEIAAAGYSYMDSDPWNPYVAASGFYIPPAVVTPPFWTNKVRSEEVNTTAAGIVDQTEPPVGALGPFTLTLVAGNGNGGAYNGFAVDLGGPFGSLTPNVLDLGGSATLTLDTLYSVSARLGVSALSPFTAIYLSCSLGRFYLPDTYGEGWAESYMPVEFAAGETYELQLYIVP